LKAASVDRVNSAWTTTGDAPNIAIDELPTVRARAKELYYNAPFFRSAVDTVVNRVVATGATLQALSSNDSFNTKAESAFKIWSYKADYFGQYHFADMQVEAIRQLLLSGGCFFHFIPAKSNADTSPFQIEIINYSSLATIINDSSKFIWNGVEVNPDTGKVDAYWFMKQPIIDLPVNQYKYIRLPNDENLLHFAPFREPHQLLGIPLAAAAMPYANVLRDILNAELVNKRISASYGLIIKKQSSSIFANNQPVDSQTGNRTINIEPGAVNYLEPDEDVKEVNPDRPGITFDPFTQIIIRGMGRAICGLSYEQISGDKSKVNFSSARHSEIELRSNVDIMRKAIERYFLNPVYEHFIKNGILLGSVNTWSGIKHWQRYLKHNWVWDNPAWIDPLKEANATKILLENNLTTLAREAAKTGQDWQDILKQRLKEKSYENSKGGLNGNQGK